MVDWTCLVDRKQQNTKFDSRYRSTGMTGWSMR